MSLNDILLQVSPKFTIEELHRIISDTYDITDINVKSITFGSDTKKGESYLSTICRFTVDAVGKISDSKIQNVSISIIAKLLPKNLGRRKTFRSLDFFNNEIIFYETVWASAINFLKFKKLPETFAYIPRCLSTCNDGINDYIALEDLTPKGYGGLNRDIGLDFEHAALVMRELAKFHGVSLAFKDQKPKLFEEICGKLQETYFSEKYRKWYANYQKMLFNIAIDAVGKQSPEYLEKLKALFFDDDFYGNLCEHCIVHGKFSAVTHGDTWLPNFLFKYDSNEKPVGVAIIDFQLTRYTSLSNDITFFLYAGTQADFREKYWDDLVEEYYKQIKTSVETMGSNLEWLTLDALKQDIKESAYFGVGMSLEAKVMALLDDDDIPDIDQIQGDEEVPLESIWIVNPFKTEEKQREIASMFKHAFDRGFL